MCIKKDDWKEQLFLSVDELVVTQHFENDLKQLSISRCFFPIYKSPLGEDHLKKSTVDASFFRHFWVQK